MFADIAQSPAGHKNPAPKLAKGRPRAVVTPGAPFLPPRGADLIEQKVKKKKAEFAKPRFSPASPNFPPEWQPVPRRTVRGF